MSEHAFITLTVTRDGKTKRQRFMLRHIISWGNSWNAKGTTSVMTTDTGAQFNVTETPEQIDELVEDAQ